MAIAAAGVRANEALGTALAVRHACRAEHRRWRGAGVLGLGATPQSVIAAVRPDFCITHAPGAMLATDLMNNRLAVI